MVLTQVLTTAAYPVVMTAATGGTSCNAANQCIGWAKMISVTYIVPKTGYVMGYAPSTVQGTVTSQYVTIVPTTLFSTSAYATGQVVSVTETQTLTSVSEQAGLSISDMLSQNLWIVLLVAVVLGVLGFRLMRRGGTGKSGVSLPSAPAQPAQGPKSGIVYCRSCGIQNPAINEFCGKCGTKL